MLYGYAAAYELWRKHSRQWDFNRQVYQESWLNAHRIQPYTLHHSMVLLAYRFKQRNVGCEM